MQWLLQTHFDRVFPSVDDEDAVLRQMAAARILVGLVALWRTGLVAIGQFYLEGGWQGTTADSAQLWVYPVVECALLFGLTVGCMTPLCLVGLIATYLRMDHKLQTFTIGSDVLVGLLILLLLCNCGHRLSLDRLFASRLRANRARTWLAWAMQVKFARSSSDYRLALWLAFLAYGLTHFSAVLCHYQDQYWRDGTTIAVMLTNSYMCRFYGFFRYLESWNPQLFMAMSVTTVVTQILFQLGMLVLVGFRFGRRFVVWYGWLFIAMSFGTLQLSYLAPLEACLWWLLFHRLQPKAEAGKSLDPTRRQHVSAVMRPFAVAYSLLLVAYIGTFPLLNEWLRDQGITTNTARKACWHMGLCVPNVFNRPDLKMEDSWFLLYRVTDSGNEVVPVNGRDGMRLWMHYSDVLYIGTSIPWRRGAIDHAPAEFCAAGQPGFDLIKRAALIDYHRLRGSRSQTFLVKLLTSRSSHIDILDLQSRYEAHLVHAFEFDIAGDEPCEPRVVDLSVVQAKPIRQARRFVGDQR